MLEMSDREKFLCDLQGFLVVKQILTPDDVKVMNDATDANVAPFTEESWTGPNEYGGGMAGKASNYGPGCLMARKGKGGHGLHGNSSRIFDGAQFYNSSNGQLRTGMTVFQYQLVDINPGDGGITVIPGSHKANFKYPEDIMLYNEENWDQCG